MSGLDPNACSTPSAVRGGRQSGRAGLTIENDGRTYAFCRSGCLRVFQEERRVYVAKTEAPVDAGICEVAEAQEVATT